MTRCFFLCDVSTVDVVDADFESKLRAYISRLAMEHDGLEFFVLDARRARAILILCAILEAKQAHPNQRILLTLVGGMDIREWVSETDGLSLPFCMFDRILQLPIDEKRAHSGKIEKWIISHSNYLFYYSYRDLQIYRQEKLYNYAKRIKKLEIIDLSSRETVCFIKNSIAKLPPDSQYLKKQLDNGVPRDTIMCDMKLTDYQLRRKAVDIPIALSQYATKRFYEQMGRDTMLPPVICTIMDFHPRTPVSEEKIHLIEQIIAFLVHDFDISLFIVEQSMCSTKMVSIIREKIRRFTRYNANRFKISVAAPYLGSKKWEKVKAKYVPLFDSVLPFIPRGSGPEQKRRMQASLLCLSDFVIYDSEKDRAQFTALINEASEHKDCAARLKVFDISRNTVEIETLLK